MLTTLVVAQGDQPSPVIPHIEEVILGLISFAILLWVLWKFAVPRFEKIYEERTQKIEGGLERAEKAQTDAQEALERYNAALAEARSEAAKIRDDARLEAEQIREELRADAQAEASRIVASGEAHLQAQKSQILAELRSELGRNSVELASRIVGESLEDEARRNRTVDRFLEELDSAAVGGGAAAGDGAAAGNGRSGS